MSVDLREKRLQSLSPAKRALLLQTLRQKEEQGRQESRIPRRAETGHAPLSFAQQGLWLLDQLEPGSPLYNIQVALRVDGPLSPAVLALCLSEIVRRHEALRTIFAPKEGTPVQVIEQGGPFELPLVDLSGLPERQREASILTLAGQEEARPFELGRGPLLRGVLLRLTNNDHVVALTMHHIVSDAWSMGILIHEVAVLYAAFAAGRPSPLPELPVQYADFSAWQRTCLHDEILQREISYWREQLAGLPPLLELPTDRPRPAVQSFRGALRPVRLPHELIQKSGALSRHEGATLFMVLLAGLQLLLARWSGQEDLAVGTSVAGRNCVEIEGLIGFFVNTLVLRGDLTGAPTFRELLGRVRESALAAYAHQDLPFDKLIQELSPERSLAHTPLFQVWFVLQNAPAEKLEIRDLRLRPVSGVQPAAKFDLTFNLEEHHGALYGSVLYATDLFDSTTVGRLILHYEQLLAVALAAPELVATELPLVTPAERSQVVVEWNDTVRAFVSSPLVHHLIARQIASAPEAVAVVCEGCWLTFGALGALSDRWAAHLRAVGVGPDVLVALFLERSVDLIVALLAVLKAGGAYLPLEISHPRERVETLLSDARVPFVLTRTRLLPALPKHSARRICLDDLQEPPAGEAPSWQPAADNLAYVLYTSGSTGRPKGVAVTHRGLLNYLLWAAEVYPVAEGRGAPVHSPISFDLTVTSLFLPLLAGGCAVLIPEEKGIDGLAEALTEGGFGVVKLTPAHLEVLSGMLPPERAAVCAGAFVIGGEPLSGERTSFWRTHAPNLRLFNEYGPTETVVGCCVWEIPASLRPAESIPIGCPIANSQMRIVDPWLHPAPIGIPGEIHIGGEGVCRGYLHRPDLTAERFVPDPFGAAGGRLYRSGDLARRLADGTIEYLGRIDHQVKLRGFRIELGEIEAAISSLPGVREAVVLAREDRANRSDPSGSGDRRLVAYVTGDLADLSSDALRQALRERLPDYMVPSVFILLAALPLTPNGKVDRKALPAPERPARRRSRARRSPAENYVAPRTPVEEILAGIWAEILGCERIGVADNFFDLGGHSLLVTRVVSRLRSTFGLELPMRTLFEAPTVADLAARVETAQRAGTGRLTPPLLPVSRAEGPLPLSFAQQRLWFLDQLAPGSPLYNIPITLRVEGILDSAVLALCLGEILRRHEALRTVFAAPEGSPVQVIQAATPFFLPTVDLSGLPLSRREALVLRLAEDEAGRPFDLTIGPLLRSVLLRLGVEDHVAALTMHHIASDGWSMGILVHEVAVLYPAFAAGRPSPLPELSVQYADFSAWQRSWLHGEILQREISYWREQLAGLPPLLELPTDRPRPAVQSLRGTTRPMRLPTELTRQVNALSRREGVTLFMVLLAGLQALLSRYSGQQDLAVGTPVAGRNQIEIEGLIGFFVNTLVLRGNLTSGMADEPSFRELLDRVRGTALAAYMHQDVPFEKLVQELAPERNLAHTPLFQVMFVLQNAPGERLEIPDLRLRPIAAAGAMAKFDLTLSLAEQDGGLYGSVGYASDLFDRTTIDRLIGHFERLLAAAVATPDLSIFSLPLLDATEVEELVQKALEGTRPAPGPGHCIHELFAAQVARTPEALAVVDEERAWTYAELGHHVQRLALRLRTAGVVPDQPVLLKAERGAGLVAGLLGILEAGGAYLAVEPDLPLARQEFLVQNARVAVAVTERRLSAALPGGVQRVFLDLEEREDLEPPRGETPRTVVMPGHLAYVLYTSGSTGQPKGVMVEHRQLTGYVQGLLERLAPPPGASFATVSSFAADLGNTSIFAALLSGGCLHVVARERLTDAAAFAELMERRPVDVLKIVPSHLAALLTAERPERSLPRRLLVLGGEPLLPSLVDRVCALAPECRLFNHYGPTETTVGVLAGPAGEAGGAGESRGARVTLGRPLGHTRVWVTDRHLQLVPTGLSGELCIGGPQVTRGYLGRPDLTAERFIPDPFSGNAGERLYRTGDLVRGRMDGRVEFIGRIDGQIKLRGFRIELGEIEAAIASLPGVREAVVVARENRATRSDPSGPGDRQLAAYVVSDASAAALQQSVRERLPDYMVPAAFVVLAALPLTPNGKIDRNALPAPEWQSSTESYLAPRTPVEEVLAGIWAGLLGLERVGTADNFFDLGGHSLLATRVMSHLRNAFGVEMALRELFEAPRLADLAARVEAARRAGAGWLAPPLAPMAPALRQGPLPLSFAQQRLWFIDQLEPSSPLYNMPVALRVEGPLDSSALTLCLAEIVRRHEVLRTVFAGSEGVPVQVILPVPRFVLPVIDLSGLPLSCRGELALRLAGNEAGRPFDLTCGPLLRGMLLRLAEEDHVIALTMHHIVSDGWSMGILVHEVTLLYPAFAEGRPSPLPELPVQYGDFAVWQHSWLHSEILESEVSFWRRQLAGSPPLLELPTDRPRPATQSYRGATRLVRLSADLSRQVEAVSRREGGTVFMILLAGFQALLARYSGQQDIAVGTPVAGRNRMETEALIGFFVNTLVLRSNLTGEPSFRELLGRVREAALAAHAHQDVPFEKLVEELAPERSLAHPPLFQVMLVLQNAPAAELRVEGLTFSPVAATGSTAKFDLTLSLGETLDGLAGAVEYAADLFDPATVERFVSHLVHLLAHATAEPGVLVSDLRLMDVEEERQLLQWGSDRSGHTWALPAAVHGLFLQQAGRTPDRIAALGPQETLTYGEIMERSSALASRIASVLPCPLDQPVALLADPDPLVLVGMLGILQAGGGFLPLDPRHPEERLAWTLRDAGCEVLVTQRRHLDRAEGLGLRHVVCLEDALGSRRKPEPPDLAPREEVTLRSLAYVVYTSGSTGRPKGVQISHENLLPILLWGLEYFGLGEHTRVLQSLSFCFDFGIFEHLTTLLAGGTLIFPGEAAGDPRAFAREIVSQGINTVHTTPVFARELAASGVKLDSLEILHLGGEALALDTVARLCAAAPRATLYNGYGPTEATINSSIYRIGEGSDWPVVAIGRSSANNALYILDRAGRPVPFGVRGDLHIGGLGVARGYLNRPDLTAERFVPDPFGPAPGGRLYRTGDLVRHLPSGDIQFLGRLDHQVKIRGFRIDLGEIESVLSTLAGVREAVVLVREDRSNRSAPSEPGDRRLVAYVTGDFADISLDALRQSLREHLPDYMVPAALVVLAALPLTPNGKVDRKALPAPEWQSPAESYVAPRTPVEEALAGIWAELLGLERIGVADDFFASGGHSLLVVRLMARIEDLLGARLPISALFEAPTVERLAALVHRREAPGRRSPLVRLHPGGAGRPLFVVHPVGGDVFAYMELARKLGTGRPVYGLQAVTEATADPGQIPSMERLAAQYLAAVREIQSEGPYLLAGWSLGAVIAYEMAQQVESSGGSVALLTMIDPSPPEPDRRDGLDDTALLGQFALDLVRLSGRRVAFGQEVLEGLGVDAAIDHLFELGQKEGVLPPDLDKPRLLERFYLFCRHAKSLERYVARPYGGRVALFRASASLAPEAITPAAGWSSLICSEPHLLAADHYSVLQSPALDRLVEHLQSALERAASSS